MRNSSLRIVNSPETLPMKKLLIALTTLAFTVATGAGLAATPSSARGLTATGAAKVDVKGKKSNSKSTKKGKAASAK